MNKSLKKIRIFAASPSDVASERAKLETVVISLKPMADYLGLTLEIIDWRSVIPEAGRPQQIIFNQLNPTSWDVFVGILWHRFGTPPGAKNKTGKDYLSGTEEEFKTAYDLWRQYDKPRMVLYRCARALPFDIDPDQLKHVRKFFKLVEDVKGDYPTLYQVFDTTESFEKLVLNNLQKLLVEYGEVSKIPITSEVEQVLAPKIPNNLPRRQAFFGRTSEMDKVLRAISPNDRTWGVLVDGIGGIGKSSIAIEAAYCAQDAGLFDAFVFVTAKLNVLEPSGIKKINPPARTLDEFLNETARVLGQSGIAKLANSEKRRALIDVLRVTRTLLLYDNLETLSKEEQEGIADFLRELPQGCKAIITSRRRGGEGGVWLRLGKLDWEAACCIIENEVSCNSVLESKLRRVELRWHELHDETNGSPLALVHTLGLLRIRATLTFDGALAILRGVPKKNDLVKFIYQEASKELTENDKKALGALSFFFPSATFNAWMRVAELSRNALETTIDRLTALSLVDTLIGEESYSVHPLTRTYIQNDLIQSRKNSAKLEKDFAVYWVDYVYQNSENKNDNYNRLEKEWFNISLTADWFLKKASLQKKKIKDEDLALSYLSLLSSLDDYLWLSGRWDESQSMNLQAYRLSVALDEKGDIGGTAYNIAWIDGFYGRNLPRKSKLWVEKCVKAWAKSESTFQAKESVRLQGLWALQSKQYAKAGRYLKRALASSRKEKNKYSVMIELNDIGKLAFEQGKMSEAKKYYKEALKIAGEIKSKEGQAFSGVNLGDVFLKQNRILEASKIFRTSLSHAQKIGRVDVIARIKCGLAIILETKGQYDKALLLAREGLVIYQKLHHPNISDTKLLISKLEGMSLARGRKRR